MLWIVDDNFLVDLDRALRIAEGLVRVGARFRWSIQATTNLTARLTEENLRLLNRAGLHQVCQGVDSASPKILKRMNKTFQDFDSIYQSAERCLKAGIRPSFNIIFGFPGEGVEDRRLSHHSGTRLSSTSEWGWCRGDEGGVRWRCRADVRGLEGVVA